MKDSKKKNSDTIMKTLQEIIIGSAIFLIIDRGVRLVSAKIVSDGEDATNRFILYTELVTLIVTVLIAWKVFT